MPLRRRYLFGYDILMGVASASASFLVSYYAFKAYLATRERYFLLLQLGFMFAGAGLLMDSLLTFFSIFARAPTLLALGYSLYFAATFISYILILGSYVVGQLKKPILYAAIPIIGYGFISETVLMLPLMIVVTQSAVNMAARKSINTLLIFLAFTLILLSHLMFALHALTGYFLVLGHSLRFTGFMLFAAFIVRVVKVD